MNVTAYGAMISGNQNSTNTLTRLPKQANHTPARERDVYIPSRNAPPAEERISAPKAEDALASKEQGGVEQTETSGSEALEGFDMKTFQAELRRQLLEQINEAKEALKEAGVEVKWTSDIPYAVDPEEKAADVPEEWNADNTSQRIVDFALGFRANASDMTDEEFISSIRGAIEEGFRQAKGDLKDLPGPSAKLFNDTYEAAMKKLDKALEDMQKGSTNGTATSAPATPYIAPKMDVPSFNAVA